MATPSFLLFRRLVISSLVICQVQVTWAKGDKNEDDNNRRPGFRLPVMPPVTDDNQNGPQIKLPREIPPRDNRNGDNRPMAAAPVPGERESLTDMQPIEKSAFPGMSCPLVDNRPHKELIEAIQALSRVVVVTPECQNNADIVKISEDARKMQEAGKALQGLWANPTNLVQNEQSAADLQTHVSTLLGGINNVAMSLQNNQLMSSKCGKQLLTAGGLLTAVSDLVTTAAPYVLLGASMNPSLSIALPFVAGITGLGTVGKVIQNMQKEGTLDISKPENREAVMQNICEFSKISQRVRFLKLAQSGQLEQVTREIKAMRIRTARQLRESTSDRVVQIAEMQNDLATMLSLAQQTLMRDQSEMREISAQLGDQPDSSTLCFAARELVSHAQNEQAKNSFPMRAVMNFKTLLENQTSTTVSQNMILNAEERTRNLLVSRSKENSRSALQECGTVAKSYFDNLNRLLATTQTTITKLSASLERELGKDPEYATYRRKERAAQNEANTMAKIANILQQLNQDNGVLDKVEMDAQMRGLKGALFETPMGLPFLRGSSPAMAWLNFVEEQRTLSLTQFSREMNSLIKDALNFSRTRTDFFKRDAQGNPLRDALGRPVPLSLDEQNYQLGQDLKSARSLEILSPSLVPEDSDNQRVICQRLENAWMSWASAFDALAAQKFFCINIQSFFDTNTEPGLLRRCANRQNLAGQVTTYSEVDQRQSELVKSGARDQALIVAKKMKELNCKKPDASVMQ